MKRSFLFGLAVVLFIAGCSETPVVFKKNRATLEVYPGETTRYYLIAAPDTANVTDAGTDQKFDSDDDRVELLCSSPVVIVTGTGKVFQGKKNLSESSEPHISNFVSDRIGRAKEIFQKCTNF